MSKPDSGTAVEQDPAVDEQDAQEEKVQDKAPTKTVDKEQEDRRKEDREEGPPPDSPRWKEVYGKWKSTERRLEEREKDVEAIREHNRALEERLNAVETNKADRPPEPEPDPAVDPDAYKKYHEMKLIQKEQEWEKRRVIDRHETQVEMQKEIHGEEKYTSMIKIAERDMVKDPELKKKIWGSPNPPKEAYRYGLKRAQEMEEQEKEQETREKTKKQVETEPSDAGGGDTEEKAEAKLNEAEIRVCKLMFPDMKLEDAKRKYLKQRKAMGRD